MTAPEDPRAGLTLRYRLLGGSAAFPGEPASLASVSAFENDALLGALIKRSLSLGDVLQTVMTERVGAVHPRKQPLYLEREIRKQDRLLAQAWNRARAKGTRVLAGEIYVLLLGKLDRCRLVEAYLVVAQSAKLPISDRKSLLDRTRSNRLRQRLAQSIVRDVQEIEMLLGMLERLGPSKHLDMIPIMHRYRVLSVYFRIQGVLFAARDKAPDGVELDALRADRLLLDDIISSRAFSGFDVTLQAGLFLQAARLCLVLGDRSAEYSYMRRCADVSPADFVPGILLDALTASPSDADFLAIVGRLSESSPDAAAEQPFSLARTRKISVFRDAWPQAIVKTATSTTGARDSLLKATLDCYYRWHFGQPVPDGSAPVLRAVHDWSGAGGVIVEANGLYAFTDVPLDMTSVGQLLHTTESGPGNWRVIERSLAGVGDAMWNAVQPMIQSGQEVRFDTIGAAGLVPLLAATHGLRAIGVSASIAMLHSRYGASGVAAESTQVPDLLVVDSAFNRHAMDVAESYRRYGAEGVEIRIVTMDSRRDKGEEAIRKIEGALTTASRVMFFVHGYSNLVVAAQSGLRVGNNLGLTCERLASMDLRHIQYAAVVACASGRPNPFVGPTSVAHALALAGVHEIVYTLWPIAASLGARVAVALLSDVAAGQPIAAALAGLYSRDHRTAAPFAIMRE